MAFGERPATKARKIRRVHGPRSARGVIGGKEVEINESEGFQELDEIGLLPLVSPNSKPRIVVVAIDDRKETQPRCRRGSRAGAARAHVAVSSATSSLHFARHTSESVGISDRSCRNGTLGSGPLKTSVKVGGLWQFAHPAAPAKRSAPRLAAARLKLPAGGGGVCKLS